MKHIGLNLLRRHVQTIGGKAKWLAMMLLLLMGSVPSMEGQDLRIKHGSRNKIEDRKKELIEFLTVDSSGAYFLKAKNVGGGLFGSGKEKFYIDRYSIPGYTIDQSLELDIAELGEDVKVLQIDAKRDSVYIFTSKTFKNEKVRLLYCSILSASRGKLLVKQKVIDTMAYERRSEIAGYRIVFSKDGNKILIQNDNPGNKSKEAERFHLTILDRNLAYEWGGLFQLSYLDQDIRMLNYIVDEQGNVAALAQHKVPREERKDKNDARVAYSVFLYSYETRASKEYDLNKGKDHLIDLQLFFEGDKGYLTIAGFYGVADPDDIDGVYYLKIGVKDLEVVAENKQLFNASDKMNFMTEKRAKKNRDLEHYIMRSLVRKEDGGLYMIAERYYVIVTDNNTMTASGIMISNGYTSTIVQNELMVVSLDEKGTKEWVRMVPKRSETNINDYYTGNTGLPHQGYVLIELGGGNIAFLYGDRQVNLDLAQDKIVSGRLKNYSGGDRNSCLTLCKINQEGVVERVALYESEEVGGSPLIQMSFVDREKQWIFLMNRSKRYETVTHIRWQSQKE